MVSRKDTLVLRTPEQVSALGSPVRFRIVDLLSLRGAASAGEIATLSGRTVTSIYYHLRVLEERGIVEAAETRGAGRNAERVYRLRAKKLVIDPKKRSASYRRALADSCASLLRRAEKDYRAAAGSPAARLDGENRDLMIRRLVLRLDEKGLARLNRLLDDLSALAAGRGGEEKPLALTVVLSRLPDRSA